MAIEAMRRLTFVQQASRDVRYKVGGLERSRLALEVRGLNGFEARAAEALKHLPAILATRGVEVRFYTPLGLELNVASLVSKTAEEIDAMAAEVDKLSQAAASRQPQNIFPQMLDVAGQTFKRIMIGELTGTEAAQFLKPEEVGGHDEDKLQALLREPSGKALTYLNVDDTKKYIEAANGQGRKFRFMTDPEFEALSAEVRSQLKGTNWFLVETSHGSGQFYWRSLLYANQNIINPVDRYYYSAVRLAED